MRSGKRVLNHGDTEITEQSREEKLRVLYVSVVFFSIRCGRELPLTTCRLERLLKQLVDAASDSPSNGSVADVDFGFADRCVIERLG